MFYTLYLSIFNTDNLVRNAKTVTDSANKITVKNNILFETIHT